MIRAFIGLDLPQGHRDALERLQEDLPLGRAMPAENFHLTLAFLGEQPEPLLEEIHVGLEAMRAPAVEVTLAGLDTFARGVPTVVFAAVNNDAALSHLRDKVRNVVRAAGLDLPRERFRPHVTLARIDREPGAENWARLGNWFARHGSFALPPFRAAEVTLFRSTLTKHGAVHDPLAVYPLGNPAA